jgi:hypothetical protein
VHAHSHVRGDAAATRALAGRRCPWGTHDSDGGSRPDRACVARI